MLIESIGGELKPRQNREADRKGRAFPPIKWQSRTTEFETCRQKNLVAKAESAAIAVPKRSSASCLRRTTARGHSMNPARLRATHELGLFHSLAAREAAQHPSRNPCWWRS